MSHRSPTASQSPLTRPLERNQASDDMVEDSKRRSLSWKSRVRRASIPYYIQAESAGIDWKLRLARILRTRRVGWALLAIALLVFGWTWLGQGIPDEVVVEPPPLSVSEVAVEEPVVEEIVQPHRSITNLPVDVDVFPSASYPVARPKSDERFLSYSPHSGYHNQRLSLENAATLAHILGRTLLVPPVWLGHAIPFVSFDKLQRRLEMASKVGLDRCKEFGEGGSEDPIPRECEGYWDWTTVNFEFLVDLKEVKELVPLRNRWNMSDEWLVDELGLAIVKGKKKKTTELADTFYLRDVSTYEYRFYDSEEDDSPLGKFENRVDIDKLARDSENFKLLSVGSMFGTMRLRLTRPENMDARKAIRSYMVFRNPVLDQVTEKIRDLLGGGNEYYGLHLRVGDGLFQQNAASNMLGVWKELCQNKMGMSEKICSDLRRRSSTSLDKRDAVAESIASLAKRAKGKKHDPLPPPRTIRHVSDSPLDSSLSCRRPLHTSESLLPFNAPLFIATDSKIPATDPHLALFFDAFPCTFILSDFSSVSPVNSKVVEDLSRLARLRNKEDKVPLAGFFYPQLDAQIAAHGREFVGTPSSTFSSFARDILHQVYHGWDIIERG